MSDLVMVVFVVYAFTLAIYIPRPPGPQRGQQRLDSPSWTRTGSGLSKELFNAFYPPRFKFPL
jgi:ABC-2 type transport system permease protein